MDLAVDGHSLKLFRKMQAGDGRHGGHCLSNIDGKIAYSLQIVVDFQHGGRSPQVRSDRLVQSQNLQTIFFNLHFPLIDFRVGPHDFAGEIGLTLHQRDTSLGDHLLDDGRQGQQFAFHRFEVAFQVLTHATLKRPVI